MEELFEEWKEGAEAEELEGERHVKQEGTWAPSFRGP